MAQLKENSKGKKNDKNDYVDPIVNTAAQVVARTIVKDEESTADYNDEINALIDGLTSTDIENAYKAVDTLKGKWEDWYKNGEINISEFLKIVDNVTYSPNQTVSNALGTV